MLPARHASFLACDMPRDLAAAFLAGMYSATPDSRQEVETQLGRVRLPELVPVPPETDLEALAQALVRQARGESGSPPAGERADVEMRKLEAKLRWIARTSSEVSVAGLPPPLAAEVLRSDCLARAVFDAPAAFADLQARYPDLVPFIDFPSVAAAAQQLGHAAAPIDSVRFEIVRKIGAGGMGQVYEAIDREQGMTVALKTMTRTRAVDLFRFKQEFRALSGIVHPNLVRLFELVSDGRQWLYTMELIDGIDFRRWVRHVPRGLAASATSESAATVTLIASEAPLSDSSTPIPDTAYRADFVRLRDALRQLAAGVHAVHLHGKLHRDLKPSNVLVQPDGRVVVLDFGLVKDIADAFAPAAPGLVRKQIAGSALYMSPEQASGKSEGLTPASDWYSVGVMLFEALTGTFPFAGRDAMDRKRRESAPRPETLAPETPPDLANLCARLLDRDPAKRPTGAALLEELKTGAEAPEEIAGSGPFVGREAQLAKLGEALTALRLGRSSVVHVYGSSGAGKSVLVQTFLRTVRSFDRTLILPARCYEQESVPYKALDSLIDAITVFLLSLRAGEAASLLPDSIGALAAVFPVLSRVPAAQQAPRPSAADPLELRRAAFSALRDLLGKIGARRLLIVHIDDLQWGDSDSAGVLAELLASPGPRLLLLASYRAEHRDTAPCVRALPRPGAPNAIRVDEVEVAPLDPNESTRLAAELLGPDRAGDAQRIAAESGGLPFFIFELARHSPGGSASGTLDDALWARVAKLPDDARKLLEAIAVAGRPLALRHVYRAAAVPPAGLPGVEILRAGSLVRRSGPGLDGVVEAFHDRVRETVAARVGEEDRRRYHLELAQSFESEGEADPEIVAIHYRGAGEAGQAAAYLERAAAQADAALAFDRAARLYREAIDLARPQGADERRLRKSLAEALAKAGRGAEAAREYRRAAEVAADEESFRLRERAAYQFCVSGLIDEGRQTFGGVLRHLGLRLPSSRRAALFGLLRRRLWLTIRGLRFRRRAESDVPRGDLDRIDLLWSVTGGLTMIDPIPGAECQAQHLLLSLRAGEPKRLLRAMAWEATHVSMIGRSQRDRAAHLLSEAEKLAAEFDDPYSRGLLALSGCVAAYFLAEPARCLELGDRGAAIFRDECAGAAWELDQCQAFGYWACYYQGGLTELGRRHDALLRTARERGARLAESQLTTFAGPFVWLARDDPRAAWDAVARVSEYWAQVEYQVYHFTLLTARSQILLYEGRAAEALEMVDREWESVKRALLLHVELVAIYMHFLRARCALAAGNFERAERDRRSLARIGTEFAEACAAQIEAALAWRDGLGDAANLKLSRAVELFERTGFGLFARTAAYRRAQLAGDATLELDWMRSQGIVDPERLASVNAPGLA
ncbi:MAG: protein kinase [Bryobacteraceae bacterium]|nr:protein kinase [Bryobacteraceae bacterium]